MSDSPITSYAIRFTFPLILIVYLLLGLGYSLASPILEPPDEMWHYPYVRHLATHGRLPPRDPDSLLGQQSTQPPLYYATAALATAWVDAGDLEELLRYNPHWGYPAAGTINDNKNRLIHTEAEAFPWQGAALAIHLARWVNLLFGALTVGATWLLARQVAPKQGWLAPVSAALVAFNPQFLFISAAVSNDAAVAAFASLSLWLLVGGVRHGFGPRRSALAGLTIGLAILSKSSGMALLPLALLAVALHHRIPSPESRSAPASLRSLLLPLALIVGVAALVAGWWFARSAWLYGDPLSIGGHLETWWAHQEPLTPAQLWDQLPQVELSYWGGFGWGNVRLPDPYYRALWLVVRLAVLGLLLALVRWIRSDRSISRQDGSMLLLVAWFGLVFIALLRWMQLVEAALGRLLFPAIGGVAVLLAWGLGHLVPRRYRAWPGAGLALGLLVVAGLVPWLVIRPAYARPPAIDPAAPPTAHQVDLRFAPGDQPGSPLARLLGYELSSSSVHPGEEVRVELCWQALSETPVDYTVFVHLVGEEGEPVVGRRDTYPGLGAFPTSLWRAGDAFCDRYRVPVDPEAPAPRVYQVQVGLHGGGARLFASDGAGSRVNTVSLAPLKVAPRTWPQVQVAQPLEREFGGQIGLLGYEIESASLSPGDSLRYRLLWQTLAPPPRDYVVFVHLRDPAGETVVQGDGQPAGGTYPTSFWAPGETVLDERTLQLPADLPPGDYHLVVGLYWLEHGEAAGRLWLPDGSSEVRLPQEIQVSP